MIFLCFKIVYNMDKLINPLHKLACKPLTSELSYWSMLTANEANVESKGGSYKKQVPFSSRACLNISNSTKAGNCN